MKYNCNMIRDLMPLVLDGAGSPESAAAVREHLEECADCAVLYKKMGSTEIENAVIAERQEVLREQKKYFKRRSTVAGTIIAGIFMIPVLVCLIVNLATGHGLTWFFIVLASLLVAASLIIVPVMAPRNKALWTLAASTASLMLLFAVICIYTRGSWFFIAAFSTLFGLAVVFLPFVVRSKPVAARLGSHKALTVVSVDAGLFILMMCAIGLKVSRGNLASWLYQAAVLSGPFLLLAFAILAVLRYLKCAKLTRVGIVVILIGLFEFFTTSVMNLLLGLPSNLPVFRPLEWNYMTVDGNIRWLILLTGLTVGSILVIIGLVKGHKEKE